AVMGEDRVGWMPEGGRGGGAGRAVDGETGDAGGRGRDYVGARCAGRIGCRYLDDAADRAAVVLPCGQGAGAVGLENLSGGACTDVLEGAGGGGAAGQQSVCGGGG